MKTRVISGIALVIILFLLLYFGGDVLLIALLLMSLIGLWEYNKALAQQHRPFIVLSGVATIVYYGVLFYDRTLVTEGPAALYLLVLYFLIMMIYVVFNYPNRRYEDGALSVTGVIYIAVLFSFVYFIRIRENGFYYSWFIFWAAWGSDTCAYFAGRALGRHKLVPRLSPKKTVEGAVGGVLGAVLICMVYGALIAGRIDMPMSRMMILSAGIGFAGAILGQVGDLFSSSIKRFMGIKDFGKLIPGHGGILDRFDSILLTGPAVVMVLLLL